MKMSAGAIHSNMKEIYEQGWHHLTQDIRTVAKLAPPLFKKGFDSMIEKTGLDVSKVKCFFTNIPTKHLMDMVVTKLRKDFKHPNLRFYSKLSTRGYQGGPSIIIALDEFMKEEELNPGHRLVSFVTESSKWMHAGFILDYC